LSVPFRRHVAEHLKHADKQATSASSRFLKAVRQFNKGKLDQNVLVRQTVSLGFQNVIDAFHVVGPPPIPIQFFVHECKKHGVEVAYLGGKHDLEELEAEERAELPKGFEEWPVDETKVN